MKKSALAVLALPLLAISLAGCATESAESSNCVEVVVNYGLLGAKEFNDCIAVPADGKIAKEVLTEAGLAVEGTLEYGDQIVCRVNQLPAVDQPFQVEGQEPHTESCADMPPAFAYWAVWQKDNVSSEWKYAEEGVGTLLLKPGQSLGLIFSTNGETPTPN